MLIVFQMTRIISNSLIKNLLVCNYRRNIRGISRSCFSTGHFNFVNKGSFHTLVSLYKNTLDNADQKLDSGESPKTREKKKKEKVTYITLIDTDQNVTVMTLEDATKVSNRRNLKLVKVKDYETKSERPTYQLLTAAQYMKEEKHQKKQNLQEKKDSFLKGTKLISISSKINDNDLSAKLRNMLKWITRRNEVRVSLSNDDGRGEELYNKISERFKGSAQIVQKRVKGNDIKFQILPLKNTTAVENSSSDVEK